MRHRKAGRRLNRRVEHRKSLLSNLTVSLLEHEQIMTTLPKAKAMRPFFERIVTLGKRGDLHARRIATARLRNRAAVDKLFSVVGPRMSDRNGGYTRILKAGFRYGDNAPVAVIELVDRETAVDESGAGEAGAG